MLPDLDIRPAALGSSNTCVLPNALVNADQYIETII